MGAVMLGTTNPQRSLWEAILPAEVIGLPTELTLVDRLLGDPVFIQPFRVHFDPILGRPRSHRDLPAADGPQAPLRARR
jgi:hypothetical protein